MGRSNVVVAEAEAEMELELGRRDCFYLKHSFIEQAFDALQDAGFRMVGACGSGTNSSGEAKPGSDSEENRWNHYNEFAFCRP